MSACNVCCVQVCAGYIMYFHAIEAVLIVFLSLTCLIGDFLISWHKVDTLIYLRIAADVGTHSAVGCLSWAIVIAPSCHWINLYEILLCGLLSGGLDVDHIFIASELNVKVRNMVKYINY